MPTTSDPIYFDNHATTKVDERVVATMLPTFTETYGNSQSAHVYGWRAKMLVEKAQASVAALIKAQAHEIHFTSGASESIQRVFSGLIGTRQANQPPVHIVSCVTEHAATLASAHELQKLGHEVTELTVNREGGLNAGDLIRALKPNTILVSLMHGNNEIGTLHPIESIGRELHAIRPDIYFHVDAAQTIGKQDIDVTQMQIDLLSLSAHKFHGPKGVGALYVRNSQGRHVNLQPEAHSGTPNVSGIVGLGAAADLATDNISRDQKRMTTQRDRVFSELEKHFGAFGTNGIHLNGSRSSRLCNNISLSIEGVETDEFGLAMKNFAFSSASACTGPMQSHVLKAIGRSTHDPFLTTARFGLSRLTTDEEISSLIETLIRSVESTREISKAYEPAAKPVLK